MENFWTSRLALFIIFSHLVGAFNIKKEVIPDAGIFGNNNGEDQCAPVNIPICRRLGYNSTSAKRDIYSNGLPPKDVEQYLSYFENDICFEDLLFFVCTLFNPICFRNHDKPVLPCKSACLSVQKECKSTIKGFHRNWPIPLNCDDLPDYETSVCITRKSIVTLKQLQKQKQENDSKAKQKYKSCQQSCESREKRAYGFELFKASDYAFEGRYISKTKTFDGGLKLRFHVRKVFKRGKVSLEKYGYIDVWSDEPCLCSELKLDKKYILLGHENKAKHQLLLDNQKSLVLKKTRFLRKLLLLWKLLYKKSKGAANNDY